MGFQENGDSEEISAEQHPGVYALVIYIPDPLGRFLDDLRRELIPGCNPHAHVSVLPPRPLAAEWQVAGEEVRSLADRWAPFDIRLGGIERFPVTNVVYIGLAGGAGEMNRMHSLMNAGVLESVEPFEYHPHITLAQEIPPGQVEAVNLMAQRRWEEFTGPRTFRAERATFVRNTVGNRWIDLAEFSLNGAGRPAYPLR
jgi:2'-5' RNA ligase